MLFYDFYMFYQVGSTTWRRYFLQLLGIFTSEKAHLMDYRKLTELRLEISHFLKNLSTFSEIFELC